MGSSLSYINDLILTYVIKVILNLSNYSQLFGLIIQLLPEQVAYILTTAKVYLGVPFIISELNHVSPSIY